MTKLNSDFIIVSTIGDFNKYLPECNIGTGRYLCFETFACVFLLKIMHGIPKSCSYYELPGGTKFEDIKSTKIQNHNTTILLSDAEYTVLERIKREILWVKL
jgi:hypothetical protein